MKLLVNKKTWWIFAVLGLIYILVWLSLSLPYRFIPGDDRVCMSFLDISGWKNTFYAVMHYYSPVHYIYLKGVSLVWGVFSTDKASCLAFAAILANTATLVLSGIAVILLTNSVIAGVMAACVFAVSAWPTHYHVEYYHASLSAALATGVIVFLLLRRKYVVVGWTAGISGLLTGLLAWSSSSAPIAVVMLLFVAVIATIPDDAAKTSSFRKIYFLCVIATVSVFAILSLGPLIGHLTENVRTDHYQRAMNRYGYVPKTPWFTYMRMLYFYNAPLCAGLCFVLAGIPLFFIGSGRVKQLYAILRENTALAAMGISMLLYMLVIDASPFTKLARSQFVLYPLTVILVISTVFIIAGKLRLKSMWPALISMLFILGQPARSIEIVKSRVSLPTALDGEGGLPIFMLAEDPHAVHVVMWLRDYKINGVRSKDVVSLLKDTPGVRLLLGPLGKNNGMSVVHSCTLPDFKLDSKEVSVLINGSEVSKVKYYGMFPPSLFEEEVCQALYFEGKVPDYKLSSSNLLLVNLPGHK